MLFITTWSTVIARVPYYQPEQTASLAIATRLFEHPSVSSRRESQLNAFPVRLSPFLLTFPKARGPVRDDWEELLQSRFRVGLQDRPHVIQWEDTSVLL